MATSTMVQTHGNALMPAQLPVQIPSSEIGQVSMPVPWGPNPPGFLHTQGEMPPQWPGDAPTAMPMPTQILPPTLPIGLPAPVPSSSPSFPVDLMPIPSPSPPFSADLVAMPLPLSQASQPVPYPPPKHANSLPMVDPLSPIHTFQPSASPSPQLNQPIYSPSQAYQQMLTPSAPPMHEDLPMPIPSSPPMQGTLSMPSPSHGALSMQTPSTRLMPRDLVSMATPEACDIERSVEKPLSTILPTDSSDRKRSHRPETEIKEIGKPPIQEGDGNLNLPEPVLVDE